MTVVVKSDRLEQVLDPGASLETLADGFGFLEGLVWNARQGALHFSDITQDKRRRWVASTGKVEIVMDPSNISNGQTFDAAGNLLVCEHATSSVVRETPGGARETIASHYQGKELNSPNDICVGPEGSIYFTDPPYGRFAGWGIERPQDLDFQGVFRIKPDGELEVVAEDFEGPNGLCFSPGNSMMYINDSAKAHIRVFDVQSDGRLTNGRIFAEGIGRGVPEEGVVDGMKCDERGDIFVTGPGGLWIFAPDGEQLGNIEVPKGVGNLAWGGDGYKTLFIGAWDKLFRMPTKVASHSEPYM